MFFHPCQIALIRDPPISMVRIFSSTSGFSMRQQRLGKAKKPLNIQGNVNDKF
jgi:hypothetical protein